MSGAKPLPLIRLYGAHKDRITLTCTQQNGTLLSQPVIRKYVIERVKLDFEFL